MITQDRSYLDAFTTNVSFVNGPSAHYYDWLSGVHDEERDSGIVGYDNAYGDIPDLGYPESDSWVQIEREGSHAGVLTTFAFLVRFASNRGRANRFYNAFLCRPFQPPVGGLPPADDESAAEPDLQQRAGCKFCHAILEPSGSHWGRWPPVAN